jgi:UDP-glucose 4-epimerase
MASILIVGGGGFIGRHAAAVLVRAGHHVFATYRRGSPVPAIQGVEWVATDLARDDLAHVWPASCDHLFFLAQARDWRTFPETASSIVAINVAGLLRAADYALRAKVRQLVYASTGSIYTGLREPAAEGQPLDLFATRNFYAATKLAGELLLQPYKPFFDVVTLRLFMPYGPDQDAAMLVPSLVRKVVEGRAIQLHRPDGIVCNPVAVRDVSEILHRLTHYPGSCILNVAGPHSLTLREIGRAIGRVVGRIPAFELQEGPPPVIVGDCAALRAKLGWTPEIAFETGLRNWLTSDTAPRAAAS